MKIKLFLLTLLTFQCIFSHKMLVFSVQKCGTHLLSKSLELLTNTTLSGEYSPHDLIKNGLPQIKDESKFFRSHLGYNKKIEREIHQKNYKAFFIYRDPRDQIVSNAYWIFKNDPNANPKKISETISFLIERVNTHYNYFMPWTRSKAVCSVKFENLIGKNGGGTHIAQRIELNKLARHLKVDPNNKLNYVVFNLYGGTATFREGKIGSWKTHFTKEQKNRFKKVAGQLLINLGYEKDFNW